MVPMKEDMRSLGVTLWNPNGPEKPTITRSPSFKNLGSRFLATSDTASDAGCIYSPGLRITLFRRKGRPHQPGRQELARQNNRDATRKRGKGSGGAPAGEIEVVVAEVVHADDEAVALVLDHVADGLHVNPLPDLRWEARASAEDPANRRRRR